jgi:ketosteroid isomerase-like protein
MGPTRLVVLGFLAAASVTAQSVAQAAAPSPPPARTGADSEFRAFLVEFEAGANRFINGDVSLWEANASHADDASLFNPFGADLKGWVEVGPMYTKAASQFVPSGASMAVEYLEIEVSGDLAYTVAIERSRVRKPGQGELLSVRTRATDIFRKENGHWKLVHRHMDHLQEPS